MPLRSWLKWLTQDSGVSAQGRGRRRFRPLLEELETRATPSANPVYTEMTGAANPFNGIDVGRYSTPKLVDLDGDGDLDLVVAAENNTLSYYKNTGTTASPTYVAQTGAANPFNGLSLGTYCTPTFGDLDGNGTLDLVAGEQNGSFRYFKNTGTTANPTFVAQTGSNNPFNGFDVGNFSTPELGDVDGDGDLDLVSGNTVGTLTYYKNNGTTTSPTFAAQTGTNNPFNGFDVGSAGSVPTLGDVDGDGDLDLVVGGDDGRQHYFKNTGSTGNPVFAEQTGAANPFNGFDVGTFSAPGFGDLDGDGNLDLVSGAADGTLHYFKAGPGLAASPTSLNLGTTSTGTAGTSQTFTASGAGLVADITVTAPTGVELSKDGGTTWQTSLTLSQTGGSVADTTIRARISAGASVGAVSGNVTVSSASATTQNVAVSGTVNAATSLTVSPTSLNLGTTSTGTAGTSQTFTASGAGLVADITVTAPTGVELSKDGGTTWQTSLTLSQTGGSVADTTIRARISAGASVGAVSGNVTVSSASATTQNVAVSGTVNAALSISSLTQTQWTVGQGSFSGTMEINGGTTPHTIVGSPTGLPTGLTATVTGTSIGFTGTPSATGVFNGSITIRDAAGAQVTKTFTITINAAPTISNLTTTAWTKNKAGFTGTMTISNGTSTHSIVGAPTGVPAGMNLTLVGNTLSFTGTPSATGVFNGSVTIRDTAGAQVIKNFTITINPPPAFTVVALPSYTVGTVYSQNLKKTIGGTGAITFQYVLSRPLPGGMTLVNGVLSGIPTTATTMTITVTATDSAGSVIVKVYTLTGTLGARRRGL